MFSIISALVPTHTILAAFGIIFISLWLLTRSEAERKAAAWIKRYQDADVELEEAVKETAGEGCKVARRLPRTALRDIADSLANEAYFKFGRRSHTQANIMITRQYMRDLIVGYPSLRKKDAMVAIDMALDLSFVPTEAAIESAEHVKSRAFGSLLCAQARQ